LISPYQEVIAVVFLLIVFLAFAFPGPAFPLEFVPTFTEVASTSSDAPAFVFPGSCVLPSASVAFW